MLKKKVCVLTPCNHRELRITTKKGNTKSSDADAHISTSSTLQYRHQISHCMCFNSLLNCIVFFNVTVG